MSAFAEQSARSAEPITNRSGLDRVRGKEWVKVAAAACRCGAMPGLVLVHARMAAARICSFTPVRKMRMGKICRIRGFYRLVGCFRQVRNSSNPCRIPLILTGIPAKPQLLPSRDRAIIQEGKGEAAERRIILRAKSSIWSAAKPAVSPIARLYRLAAMSGYALAPMAFKAKWLASPCGR